MTELVSFPTDLPLDKPNPARIYDYWLGGYHNFEMDRLQAEQILKIHPDFKITAKVNRTFLRRVVQFLAAQGIEQFLDLCSGIPTASNVHEIAQAATPHARVVYVDLDPIAVAHSQAILRDNPRATAIQGDIRSIALVLENEQVKQLLDWDKPMAALAFAALHYALDDAEAYGIVHTLYNSMVSRSYLALSHFTYTGAPASATQRIDSIYAGKAERQTAPRDYATIVKLFDGFDLVEPGVVYLPLWRTEEPNALLLDQPERSLALGGVGRKP